jgi:hypothetical protein
LGFWRFSSSAHLLISSGVIRPRLVDRLGEQASRDVHSLVALATFIPLVTVFGHHKHSGPVLWYFRASGPIRWLARLIMLAAVNLSHRGPAQS